MVRASELKDAVLDSLASRANVAQFVSFSPGESPGLRFQRVVGLPTQPSERNVAEIIDRLFERCEDRKVNIRCFRPEAMQGGPFMYGLTVAQSVSEHVRRLARDGWFTIVNETIDVSDGGVSGVALGDTIEFSPDDTPRCVEKPGVCHLPRGLALRILHTIYGFQCDIPHVEDRVEFSIHPLKRGFRRSHTILWEWGASSASVAKRKPAWPNRMSRFLGDKAFGLLIADACGLPVPATTVISKRIAPFRFGIATGSGEFWMRTAPSVQQPGRFLTTRGWSQAIDHVVSNPDLASVLSQEGVEPRYSGGAACQTSGDILVEGVHGSGVRFMLGQQPPEDLPESIVSDVSQILRLAQSILGDVRIEWVHDGERPWVIQIHSGGIRSEQATIVDGAAAEWVDFEVVNGLEDLRRLLEQLPDGTGVRVVGDVGLTSHFGDLLRLKRVPSILINH